MRKRVGEGPDFNEETKSASPGSGLGLEAEFASLAGDIQTAYDEGVSLEHAERLAAKCLGVQLKIAEQLAASDLDSRMKKSGLKAIKSAVYMKAATASDKKPSDTLLENVVNLDNQVATSQDLYDSADARKESLTLFFGIFREAHIYFRGISRGRYE